MGSLLRLLSPRSVIQVPHAWEDMVCHALATVLSGLIAPLRRVASRPREAVAEQWTLFILGTGTSA